MDLLVGSGKDYGDDAHKIVLANCEAIGDKLLKKLICMPDVDLDSLAIDTLQSGNEKNFDWLCNAIECIRYWWKGFTFQEVYASYLQTIEGVVGSVDFESYCLPKDFGVRVIALSEHAKMINDWELMVAMRVVVYWFYQNRSCIPQKTKDKNLTLRGFCVIHGDSPFTLLLQVVEAAESGDIAMRDRTVATLRKKGDLQVVGSKTKDGNDLDDWLQEVSKTVQDYRKFLRLMAKI